MVFGPRKAYSERLLCMYRNAALAVCTLLHHFMTQLLPCPRTPELLCSASQHMTCSGLRALTLDFPVPRSKPGCAVQVFRWSHGGRKKRKRQECVGRPLLYLPCPVPLFRWAVSSLFLYTTWGVLREQVPGLVPSWSCSSFQHTVTAPYSSSGADCGIQGTEDVERIQD